MIDAPRISFTEIAKPLRKEGELNGDFMIVVAVEEVQFADGSRWRRAEPAAFLRPGPSSGPFAAVAVAGGFFLPR